MSQLTPFNFKGEPVRVVEIDGDAWLVISDVCRVLGHSNPTMAMEMVDVDDRRRFRRSEALNFAEVFPDNRIQSVNLINESGLYALVFSSKLPSARDFRRWVTSEVLPQIRKTGQYAPAPMSALDALAASVALLQEQERRTAAIEAQQAEIGQRQNAIENRVTQLDANSGWVTAMGWSNVNGLAVTDNATMARLGRKASAMLRGMGIERRTTTSEVFGIVNIYPDGVLEQAAEELGLI